MAESRREERHVVTGYVGSPFAAPASHRPAPRSQKLRSKPSYFLQRPLSLLQQLAQRPRPRIQAKSIEHVFHLGPPLPHARLSAHCFFANFRIFAKLSVPAAPQPDSPAGTAGRNCL
jgi:hypothetical protein